MANQIVVSAGAKVRNLSGVLTATSGVVSFLPIDVSLGIPQLDVNGKILVSQLPNSVMEYKGTWNAATNTPTLVNGTGNQGDVYLCNVAGTVNFGAGAIAFVVGDQVIYSGSIWQRASGATGTVTSVAVTESGDSLNITGSPITTSGTINIGFNGTNLQYVNGAGNLTTFPILTGYVTAVSGTAPVVSSGGTTPAISMAAATASVDGYLDNADWSTFNAKQNAITLTTTGTSGASTLVGATLNIPNYGSALTGYVPYTGATQDVDLGAFSLNGKSLHIKGTAGNGHLGLKHQSASATASANEVSLFADSLGDLGWLNGNLYLSKFITSGNSANRSYTFPNATCNIPDDSLVVHLAGTETITGAKTFSGGVTFSSSVTTNNLTFANSGFFLTLQPPTLSVNRTVTLPDASGTLALTSNLSSYVPYTGATANVDLGLFSLTSNIVKVLGDNSTYGGTLSIRQSNVTNLIGVGYTELFGKTNRLGISFGAGSIAYLSNSVLTAERTFTLPDATGTIALVGGSGVGTVTSVAALTIGTTGTDLSSSVANSTTTPVITLNVPTASATNRGALSSGDWSTFNNKQSALTIGNLGSNDTNFLSVTGGAGSVIGSGTTIYVYPYNIVSSGLTLTTTGSSGAATKVTNTLNIPTYTLSGLGGIGGSGTTNYLPKFTGASTIGNSQIFDNGTNVGIGTSSPSALLHVGSGGGAGATNSIAYLGGYSTGVSQLRYIMNHNGAANAGIGTPSNGGILFGYGAVDGTITGEWMRITSGGQVIAPFGYQSFKGSVSIGASATTTIHTMTSDGVYYVYCRLNGGAAIYMASAIVTSLATNGESFISNTRTGANVALTVSGAAIRITNGGFSTFTWQWSILFQPVD